MVSRDERFRDVDASRISMHVWEVRPWWLRTVLPFAVRRRIAEWLSEDTVTRWGRRLTYLKCLAVYRMDPQPSSGVRFRKGKGLVGTCVEKNKRGKALFVDLESPGFQSAIASEGSWTNASPTITMHLSYREARTLAERYGQAAAWVIQDESGEAIGGLTMSLPTGCPVRIEEKSLNDLVLSLGETADIICSVLTGRKGTASLN
jgi:hypothetical protein